MINGADMAVDEVMATDDTIVAALEWGWGIRLLFEREGRKGPEV